MTPEPTPVRGTISDVSTDGMSDKHWGFDDDGWRWRWAVRGPFLLAVPGWLSGANGLWGVWAGLCLVAAGLTGLLAPRSAIAASPRAISRLLGSGTTTVLNRVGAAGFIGFGIFAFVHGLLT
jgi:hypothetical protein